MPRGKSIRAPFQGYSSFGHRFLPASGKGARKWRRLLVAPGDNMGGTGGADGSRAGRERTDGGAGGAADVFRGRGRDAAGGPVRALDWAGDLAGGTGLHGRQLAVSPRGLCPAGASGDVLPAG